MSNTYLLSQEEKDFLDKNGYLLIENVLTGEEIKTIKSRIDEVMKLEGTRAGDIRSGEYRRMLTAKGGIKSWFLLKLNTLVYRIMKFLLVKTRKKFPLINLVTYMSTLNPDIYRNVGVGFRSDMKQMFLNIVQQQEDKVQRLCNLVNKGKEFEVFFTHPKVINTVKYIIGEDFKLSSLNMRAPKKDCWVQPLHADWTWNVKPGSYYTSNTLWMLDDIDEDNGPTRIIPGTHFTGKLPSEVIDDLQVPLDGEVHIVGKAGSVLVLNGHVWHGGTKNNTGKSRQLIQSYFVHKAHHPQQFQPFLLEESTKERLDKRALEILDFYE